MALARAEIIDAISNLSVLELSTLIKDMEEKFGVSAAQPLWQLPRRLAGALRQQLRKD
jgi:large subunit ribosomal protein L7/L12